VIPDEKQLNLSTDDYIAIQQLYARYAFSVDLRDVDGWLASWTEDGALVTTSGKRISGRNERRALMETYTSDSNERGYHWVGNIVIAPTDGGAAGKCYLMHVFAPDGPAEIRYAYYYEDELVKQDGRWLFRLRTIHALNPGVGEPSFRGSDEVLR
jgi:uncharacterized protein (TIGR02246 family)